MSQSHFIIAVSQYNIKYASDCSSALLHECTAHTQGNKSELVMEGPVSKALQDKMLLSSGIEESNVMLGLPQPSELKTAGLQVEASG